MSQEMSGHRHGDRGRAPLFQGERLEVRVVRVVVWVDGRKGARGTAETGSSGQGVSFVGLCSGAAERRERGKAAAAGGRRVAGEEDEPLPVQAPAVLRHKELQPAETLIYEISCPSC